MYKKYKNHYVKIFTDAPQHPIYYGLVESILEKSVIDISAFINESQKNATLSSKPNPEPKKPLKKIIPIKKKKKMPVEGGC